MRQHAGQFPSSLGRHSCPRARRRRGGQRPAPSAKALEHGIALRRGRPDGGAARFGAGGKLGMHGAPASQGRWGDISRTPPILHRRGRGKPSGELSVEAVNHSLGLTFYCSGMPLEARPLEFRLWSPSFGITRPKSRFLAIAAIAALLALPAAGCRPPATISPARLQQRHAAQRGRVAAVARRLGRRYRANPDDAEAAMAYASRPARHRPACAAVAVLEQASIRIPAT